MSRAKTVDIGGLRQRMKGEVSMASPQASPDPMPNPQAWLIAPILVLLAAGSAAAQAPALKVDIPYQAVGIGVTPLWTAIEGGLFRPYGIEATTEFVSQSPVLVAAMLSGDTPFAIAGEDAVISADLRGGDIAILASGPEKLVFTIYAAKRLHDIADLKGGKIGISQFGATTDFIARYILKHAGLRPDQDATILAVGTQANNLVALQAGAIDATVLAPPTTLKAKALGFNAVADMGDYDLLFYTSALVGKKSWIAAHREETMNVVRGYVAGVAAVHRNKPAAIAALAKYSRTTDGAVLESSYEALLKVLPKVPLPRPEALAAGLEGRAQPAAKTADPASFIDPSFVAALERDGFIDRLYR
jgi:NitT/TauT family transport system substrate-binding protein